MKTLRLLNPPNVNSFILFRNIVLDKDLNRRNQLIAIEKEIKDLYKNYIDNKANLENIPASTYVNPEKEDLLHCYNSNTKGLDKLKSIIGNNPPDEIKNRCLYCLIGNSTSLDHYLPKEDFPEFAVNIFNLFPCCGTCNSKKGVNWLIGGRRRFINFYYENIPPGQYLKAKIRFFGIIPKAKFKIVKPTGMLDETFDIISSHYEKLELLKRFSKNSNEVFSEARLRVKRDCQGLTTIEIRNLFLGEAQLWSELIQENYWKVALYEAMANNSQFVDYCFVNL